MYWRIVFIAISEKGEMGSVDGIEQRVGGWRSGPVGLEVGGRGQPPSLKLRRAKEDRRQQ